MAVRNVLKFSTSLVIIATTWLGGCGEKSSDSIKNPLSAPTLNQTETKTLVRRGLTADNYNDSCLFLNDSFKQINTASICLQSDLSLTGVQVTNQTAEFRLLNSNSSISTFSLDNTVVIGQSVKPDDIKSGDIFYFKKSNSNATYDMIVEIVNIDSEKIEINYQVKNFQLLW